MLPFLPAKKKKHVAICASAEEAENAGPFWRRKWAAQQHQKMIFKTQTAYAFSPLWPDCEPTLDNRVSPAQ
jgi:hypothetical protein